MLGAIVGDIIGSPYERFSNKSTQFPLFKEESRFTDDTVLTIAVADVLMNNKDYVQTVREYGRAHPTAGYGGTFIQWLGRPQMGPYNSWGNGSAMRVSPVAWLRSTLDEVLEEAKKSAEITHNHPEGIKGSQAIASSIFMARTGSSKEQIKEYIKEKFDYNLDRTLDEIRPTYEFDVSCQGSVPEAIISFMESNNFEDCIRKAISLGGDSDTIAAMAGGIAEAYYKEIPADILKQVKIIIDKAPKFVEILNQFIEKTASK
jgi:ADP-ribosylglycohydrolase